MILNGLLTSDSLKKGDIETLIIILQKKVAAAESKKDVEQIGSLADVLKKLALRSEEFYNENIDMPK